MAVNCGSKRSTISLSYLLADSIPNKLRYSLRGNHFNRCGAIEVTILFSCWVTYIRTYIILTKVTVSPKTAADLTRYGPETSTVLFVPMEKKLLNLLVELAKTGACQVFASAFSTMIRTIFVLP